MAELSVRPAEVGPLLDALEAGGGRSAASFPAASRILIPNGPGFLPGFPCVPPLVCRPDRGEPLRGRYVNAYSLLTDSMVNSP